MLVYEVDIATMYACGGSGGTPGRPPTDRPPTQQPLPTKQPLPEPPSDHHIGTIIGASVLGAVVLAAVAVLAYRTGRQRTHSGGRVEFNNFAEDVVVSSPHSTAGMQVTPNAAYSTNLPTYEDEELDDDDMLFDAVSHVVEA